VALLPCRGEAAPLESKAADGRCGGTLRSPTKFLSGENCIRKDGDDKGTTPLPCSRADAATRADALEMRRHTPVGASHMDLLIGDRTTPGGLKFQLCAECWRLLQEASY
jgi:hypothetical protein